MNKDETKTGTKMVPVPCCSHARAKANEDLKGLIDEICQWKDDKKFYSVRIYDENKKSVLFLCDACYEMAKKGDFIINGETYSQLKDLPEDCRPKP